MERTTKPAAGCLAHPQGWFALHCETARFSRSFFILRARPVPAERGNGSVNTGPERPDSAVAKSFGGWPARHAGFKVRYCKRAADLTLFRVAEHRMRRRIVWTLHKILEQLLPAGSRRCSRSATTSRPVSKKTQFEGMLNALRASPANPCCESIHVTSKALSEALASTLP